MIDKVEVRVPAKAQFSPTFQKLYCEISRDPKINPFRSSQHYLRVGDLRPFDYQAILHMHCIRDKKQGNHKLELLDTGQMSYSAMRHEIERIFDLDGRRLPLMRVDLAVDIRDLPVAWFVAHVRARWKQWVADIGLEYARMGRRQIQTFYLGKRPNCFRIYDKLAEFHYQYTQLTRRLSDAAELPTFEEQYGYPENGIVLTRVERQMGGGRVPAQIDTFGKLKTSHEFNPFQNLEVIAAGVRSPQIEDYGLNRFGFGMWLRSLAEDIGMHRLRAFLHKHSGRHAARVLEEYREFLPAEAGITAERLYATYQDSVTRQLAA